MGLFCQEATWLSLFLLLCCLTLKSARTDCNEDVLYLIRHIKSGLVVDSSDPTQLRIQYFDGFPSQLWKFERGDAPGLFHIVSNSTGNVLDYNPETKLVYTNARDNSPKQQWFLHFDGLIVNAFLHGNLDIANAEFVPGTPLQVVGVTNYGAQEFNLQPTVL